MSLILFTLLLLSAFGAGAPVLTRLGGEAPRDAAGFVLAAALGTALLGTLALLLGGVGLLRPLVLVAVTVGTACLGVAELVRWRRGRHTGQAPAPGALVRLERGLAALLLAACMARLAWFAWYPDLRIDAYMYHITVPRQWLMRGWAAAFAYEPTASFHLLWDAWYAYGLAFARDDFILPSLWHSAAAVGVAVLLHGEVQRHGHPRLAVAAALGWLAAGEVLESSACAYVDNAVALYVLAATITMTRMQHRRDGFLAGLFLGAAVGAKATSIAFVVAVLGAWFLARLLKGEGKGTGSALGAVAAGVALLALPWAIRNGITTGNPFYPFVPDLLRAWPEFDFVARDFLGSYPGVFAEADDGGMSLGGLAAHANLFLANTRLITQNLVAVAALVGVLAMLPRWRMLPAPTVMVGLLAAGLVPMVVMSPARRFALGAEAVQILAACMAIGSLARHSDWVRQPTPRVALLACALALFAFQWRRGGDAQLGFEHRRPPSDTRAYLTAAEMRREHHDRHPDAPIARLLESNVGRDGCVLVTENSFLLAIANVRIHPNPHMHSPNALRVMAEREGLDADAIAGRLRAMGVTHLLTTDAMDTVVLADFSARHLRTVGVEGELRLLEIRQDD